MLRFAKSVGSKYANVYFGGKLKIAHAAEPNKECSESYHSYNSYIVNCKMIDCHVEQNTQVLANSIIDPLIQAIAINYSISPTSSTINRYQTQNSANAHHHPARL